ncbi:MAG: rhomboid family intramembrane serine protease [Lachnospiraceae bacterium]|nr:rhomboid family intramembrane serine protease [Lachnospiraceae bacterium]
MERFLAKMEMRIGKYAVRDLMRYITAIYVAGAVIGLLPGSIYYRYLSLDFSAIAHGQVWRLITFILQPVSVANLGDIILLAVHVYFYLWIGRNLENAWGTFRFNVYYLSGIVLQILAGLLLFVVTKDPYSSIFFGLGYVNDAMLLAFCVLYPNVEVLLMFVLPIKVKWIGIFYAVTVAIQIFVSFIGGSWYLAVAIIMAILNFFLFYLSTGRFKRRMPGEVKRKVVYKVKSRPAHIAKHKCAICGRTSETNPELEFRFCSKCNGNYEYCNDHLFTHTHIQ